MISVAAPIRRLAISTFLHTTGTGLVISLGAVYFTRIVGIAAGEYGAGLAASATIALGAGVPLGKLAERLDPKRMLVTLLACQGIAVALYATVASLPGFLAVTVVFAFINEGALAVRSTLVAEAVPAEQRVHARAILRTVTNIGFAGGAALASVALSGTDRAVYRNLLIVGAACFGLAAMAMARAASPRGADRERRAGAWTVVRDGPYLALTAANSFLQMHYSLFEIAIPPWITSRLIVPHEMVSVLFVLNTAIVVALQMPVSSRFGVLSRAGRMCVCAGIALAATDLQSVMSLVGSARRARARSSLTALSAAWGSWPVPMRRQDRWTRW